MHIIYRLTLAFLCISCCAHAQQISGLTIAEQKPLQVKQIERDTNNLLKVFLKTDFAEAFIIDSANIRKLNFFTILQVDLVYSQYRSVETFNQRALNEQRLRQLEKSLPGILENKTIKWRLIEQTGASEASKAEKLFHGFVFWLMPKKVDAGYSSESTYLETVMDEAEKNIPLPCQQEVKELMAKKLLPAPPSMGEEKEALKIYLKETLGYPEVKAKKATGLVTCRLDMNENGQADTFLVTRSTIKVKEYEDEVLNALESMPAWKASDTVTGRVKYQYFIKVFYNVQSKTKKILTVTITGPRMVNVCTGTAVETAPAPLLLRDSSLLKIFNRNPQWNNILMVVDVTGSMSPYSSQLLIWYQLMLSNSKNRIKYFSFFNDGNATPDSLKKVGSTGGIYGGRAETITAVKELAYSTMDKGGGGDNPENNVEALIASIRACPDCKDIIMVADNYATPRDLGLLRIVNRPVKIILCGTSFGINANYLSMARNLKGSIHLPNQDITNLATMKEGDTIYIGPETFKLVRGRFIKIIRLPN